MTATDLVLLKRWQTRRDPEAFQELVHRHANMVFATCRRVLGNAADAEEVAQDCFLSLADSANKPTRSLGGWLHVLATSRARDRIRGDVRRRQREERFAAEQEPSVENPDAVAILDDALAALPDRLREPLVVHFLEGLTHAETAKRLGVSRPTVTRRINKALEKLREEMRGRKAVITVAALTKLMTAEAASAAPATLIAQLGTIALNASPYAVAAGGGGLLVYGLGAVAIIAILAGLVGIAAPRALQWAQTQNAQNTVVATPDDLSIAAVGIAVTTVVETLETTSSVTETTDVVVETSEFVVETFPDPAGARIHGYVYDLAGNPAKDVHVEVHNDQEAFEAGGEDRTDEEGHYSIDGVSPTGMLYVQASQRSPALRSPPFEIGAVVAGQDYEADLVLHDTLVSGVVVDDSGRVIPGAKVAAQMAEVKIYGTLPVAVADSLGRFEISGLFAGEHKMSVRIGGRANPYIEASRINLNKGEHRTGLRLVHEVGRNRWIWGSITDIESNPIKGAKVDVYTVTHDESTFATTDVDGTFLIAMENDGPFYVQVGHREFSGALKRNVMPDTGPLYITLEPYGGLQGTVVDGQSNNPIQQFEVKESVPVSEEPDTMYHTRWRAVNDPNGAFSMARLSRGQKTVHIRANGFADAEQTVQIRSGADTSGVVIAMNRARRISGSVVDHIGQPVVGARVFAGPLPSSFRSSTLRTQEPVLTDAEGRFEISDASTKLQMVSASHHAYAPVSQPVSSDLSAIQIVLYEGGSASGTVTLNGAPAINATVFALLNPESHPVSIARARTGEQGEFELPNVGPGPVLVYADLDLEPPYGERNISRTITVDDGKITPVYFDFKIGEAGVEGMVSLDGLPIADAVVVVSIGANRQEPESSNVRSDANGHYRIEGLLSGTYELRVLIPGLDQAVQPAATTITLTEDDLLHLDLTH